LPGDELFPAASTVGVQALLASRLQLLRGVSALGELTRAIADDGSARSSGAPTTITVLPASIFLSRARRRTS
jgi:hypothetical protein